MLTAGRFYHSLTMRPPLTDAQRDLAAAMWPEALSAIGRLARVNRFAARHRDELTSFAAAYVVNLARRYDAAAGMTARGYAVARLQYLYAEWTREQYGRRGTQRAATAPPANLDDFAPYLPMPHADFAAADARADAAALLELLPDDEREAVARIDLAGEPAEALGRGRSFAFELRRRAKLRLAEHVRG